MLDYCIKNGMVLDGSGGPAIRADVGISGKSIAAVGDLSGILAANTIDADGRTICPGFLDMHRHADAAIFREDFGDGELMQGITTIGNGNCGLSLVPQCDHHDAIATYLSPVTGDFSDIPVDSLASYHRALKQKPLPLHAMMLAGGGTIRASVAGFLKTSLDDSDFRKIHSLLEKMLSEGACGISLGLGYAPECFYTTKELIRALEPIRNTGIVVSVHMREEAMRLLPSMDEVISVAKSLRIPLQISHLKATGKENWNRLVPIALEKICRAREDGLDVLCDVYPYTAGSTQLIHILPPEMLQGGTSAITARLCDSRLRTMLLDRLQNGTDFDNYSRLVGWENILLSSIRNPEDAVYVGESVADAAGNEDPASFALNLLARNDCAVTMIDFITTETDIAAILQSPFSYAISDATYPTGGKLHPRVYGAFPMVIEEYVCKRHALSLSEAIHKMTGIPADRYGLKTKGRIRVGADADVLIFHPQHVHVAATYAEPNQFAAGMDYVFVNGRCAVSQGKRTDVYNGTVLEGTSC